MAKTLEERVKRVLAEQLCVEESACTETAKLQDDLGADSLDLVECIMALEEEFEIDIPDGKAASVVIVQDAIDLVKAIAG